jgi:urease accessory protein
MDFLLWQLVDSGFPSGGFAHSGGLEASVQHGHVRDVETLYTFTRHALVQAGSSALPLVTAAHRDPETLPDLDAISDAFLSSPVANRASRAQGRAFLTSTSRSFPGPRLAALADRVRAGRLPLHHAPVFGAVLRALDAGLLDAQRLFLFLAIRGIGSAAIRLGLVGAYEAQQLQAAAAGEIDATVASCAELGPADVAQTAPLIELYQSTHDHLYSRLFQS